MATAGGMITRLKGPFLTAGINNNITGDVTFVASTIPVAIISASFRSGSAGGGTNSLDILSGGSGGTSIWTFPRLALDEELTVTFPAPGVFSEGIYLDITDVAGGLGTSDFSCAYYVLE